MRQDKTIKIPILVASLTLAAFLLADTIDTIIGKNLASAVKHPTSAERGRPRMDPLRGPGEHSFIKKPARANVNANVADGNSIEKSQGIETCCAAGIKKISDSTWSVDKKALPANTTRLNQMLMQARIVPSLKRGRTVGLQISQISPGSFYEKIGLQNGDVLMRVNLQDLTTTDRLFKLYRKLRSQRTISVDLYRSGKLQTLNYDIH